MGKGNTFIMTKINIMRVRGLRESGMGKELTFTSLKINMSGIGKTIKGMIRMAKLSTTNLKSK